MKVRYFCNCIPTTFSVLPDKTPDLVKPSIISAISKTGSLNSIPTSKKNDAKKKRNIEDYLQFDEFTSDNSDEYDDIKIEHKLHPKVKETPAQIHDNADSK